MDPRPTCKLLGVERSFGSAQLKAKYADIGMYMDAFTKSLDATSGAGYLFQTDRQAIVQRSASGGIKPLPVRVHPLRARATVTDPRA